jgi:hypothetical protein
MYVLIQSLTLRSLPGLLHHSPRHHPLHLATMSLPTKNESPVSPPMNHESSDEATRTLTNATDTRIGVSELSQNGFDEQVLSRRPRNPFILFRTWYIKQGYLKQVTVSEKAPLYRIELTMCTSPPVVN